LPDAKLKALASGGPLGFLTKDKAVPAVTKAGPPFRPAPEASAPLGWASPYDARRPGGPTGDEPSVRLPAGVSTFRRLV